MTVLHYINNVLVPQAHALSVGGLYRSDTTLKQMVTNFTNVLLANSAIVLAAIFLTGAFFYAISAGAEDRKGFGKSLMIGSVLGAIVIAGSFAIFNFVLFLLDSF